MKSAREPRYGIRAQRLCEKNESLPGSFITDGVGLYTILFLPILHDLLHTEGRSREGRILPHSRAIVLQQCGQCRRAGRMNERLIRAQTTRSERTSCEGQRRFIYQEHTSTHLPGTDPGVGLYKIFAHLNASVNEPIINLLAPLPVMAILLQSCCTTTAQRKPLPRPFSCMLYAIHYL